MLRASVPNHFKGQRGRHSCCLQISVDGCGWLPGADCWLAGISTCSSAAEFCLPQWAEMGYVWNQLVRVRALFSEPSFNISGYTDRMSSERGLLAIGFNGRRWGLPPTLTWRTIQTWEVGSNQSPSWVHGWLKGLWTILLIKGLHSHNWPVWLVIPWKAKPAVLCRRLSCCISKGTHGVWVQIRRGSREARFPPKLRSFAFHKVDPSKERIKSFIRLFIGHLLCASGHGCCCAWTCKNGSGGTGFSPERPALLILWRRAQQLSPCTRSTLMQLEASRRLGWRLFPSPEMW